MVERRAAERHPTRPIAATVNGLPVFIVELSRVGARIQHTVRFPLENPRLAIRRPEGTLDVSIRVVRSEIVGRKEGRLIYQSGVQISSADPESEGVLAAILREARAAEQNGAFGVAPAVAPMPTLDDTWTRQVRVLRDDPDGEPDR